MVAASWLITFSIMIPTWLGVWGRFGLDTSIGSCSILHDKYDRSPKEFLFMVAFMLPCICIVICYARIFLLVRKAAIRAASKNTDLPTTPPVQPTPQAPKASEKSKDKNQSKSRDKNQDKDKGKNKNKAKDLEAEKDSDSVGKEAMHPFFVTESLAYIDDNVSTASFPISYSIKPEVPIDANVVLQKNSLGSSKDTLSGSGKVKPTRSALGDSNISKSQTLVEQAKNS